MLTVGAFLSKQLSRVGIPERWHQPIACIGATLATIAAVALIIHCHTQRLIAAHDLATVEAAAAASDRANDAAMAADAIRTNDAAARAADIQGAIEHAETSHPAEVRAASGPAVNAVADRLRARQAKARAAAD